MLAPAFNPAALGLTSGRPVYYTGSAFASMLAVTYAASGKLVSAAAGAGTDTPLQLKTAAAGQSANTFEVIRGSDSQVGVRVLGHSSVQAKTNLIVGGNDTVTDDGNPRLWLYNGATPKVLLGLAGSAGVFELASDGEFRWDSGTSVTGSVDLGLARTAAGVLSVNDADATGNPSVALQAKSSTTAKRDRARLNTAAVDNTDATRKYRVTLTAFDTAEREVLRGEASGTAPMLGVLGAAAIARQTVAANATDLATAIALVNDIKAKLSAAAGGFGFFT